MWTMQRGLAERQKFANLSFLYGGEGQSTPTQGTRPQTGQKREDWTETALVGIKKKKISNIRPLEPSRVDRKEAPLTLKLTASRRGQLPVGKGPESEQEPFNGGLNTPEVILPKGPSSSRVSRGEPKRQRRDQIVRFP